MRREKTGAQMPKKEQKFRFPTTFLMNSLSVHKMTIVNKMFQIRTFVMFPHNDNAK